MHGPDVVVYGKHATAARYAIITALHRFWVRQDDALVQLKALLTSDTATSTLIGCDHSLMTPRLGLALRAPNVLAPALEARNSHQVIMSKYDLLFQGHRPAQPCYRAVYQPL